MKRIGKYIGVLLAVLFLSSSAWALNVGDHVTIAPNNAGDLLFFKYYVVGNGGWTTKVSVTNTNTGASVVAKVVIRSAVNSTELLDFLIYLSPGDVWNATLYYDGTQTKIYSEDGSCLNASGTWASATAPLDYALKTIGTANMAWCADQDTTQMGYIYVVMAAWSNDNSGTIKYGTPGVTKAQIKTAYEVGAGGVFDTWTQVLAAAGTWINPLTGYQVFQNSTLGLFSAADKPVFLRDYKSITYLATAATNRLGSTDSNNSIGEIEAALAKTNVSLPYVDDANNATVHITGFPTKYTTSANCTVSGYTYIGPFFTANVSLGSLPLVGILIWDMDENSTTGPFSPSPSASWRNEVNIFAVSSLNTDAFAEGWVQYPMSYSATVTTTKSGIGLSYIGAPMTTSVVHFGAADAWGIGCGWNSPVISIYGYPTANQWNIIKNYEAASQGS